MNDTVIIHSGVKNQKWGQRRYQNEDGSLTPEGRIHYGVGQPRDKKSNVTIFKRKKKVKKEKPVKEEKKKSKDLEKQLKEDTDKKLREDIKSLSNDEIRSRMDRIKLEQDYYNMLNGGNKKVDSGKEKTKSFKNKLLDEVTTGLAKGVGASAQVVAQKYLTKKLGDLLNLNIISPEKKDK